MRSLANLEVRNSLRLLGTQSIRRSHCSQCQLIIGLVVSYMPFALTFLMSFHIRKDSIVDDACSEEEDSELVELTSHTRSVI